MKHLLVILPFDAKILISTDYILYVRSISLLSLRNKQITDVSSVGTLFGLVLLHTCRNPEFSMQAAVLMR